MSQSSWLVAGIVLGVKRQPLKKFAVDENALLKLLNRWREEAENAGHRIKRIVDSWLAYDPYINTMCGRIIQASGPLRYQLVDGLDVPDSRLSNIPRRYNGAPGQELFIIRQNHETGERSLDLLKWGLIPSSINDPKGRPKPINAMAETVRSKRIFRHAYRKRRCIVPVDGFFEWQATRGGKRPYAIGMKNGASFGLAGLWENWKDPATDEWVRTFTIITVPSNEVITQNHDRMPAILQPADYER
jgi:putative SOS response-associated peptidase YedK